MKKIEAFMKLRGLFAALLILAALTGCATAAKEIQVRSQSEKTGVFTEVGEAASPIQGYATLTIKASIKTHLAGYSLLESRESSHGKSTYPFLISIDGQAVTWSAEGQRESVPLYDKDGKASHDPEAGEGMKYVLDKRLRLRAGTHKVFFGLSADDVFKEVEITLEDGGSVLLEFKPVYRYKTFPIRISTFLKGIKEFVAYERKG